MTCHNCRSPITAQAPRVVQMTGWVKDRKAGGVNQLRSGEPTGNVLCRSCGDVFWATGRMPSWGPPQGQMVIE